VVNDLDEKRIEDTPPTLITLTLPEGGITRTTDVEAAVKQRSECSESQGQHSSVSE
jgi:hypothetical protein